MVQIATSAALQALSEWWEDMGVALEPVKTPTQPPDTGTSDSLNEVRPAPESMRSHVHKAPAKSVSDWVAQASADAAACKDLPELRQAIDAFDGSPLKPLCNRAVIYDGTPGAPVMVLGEGPGGQEDRIGLPFVGKAGQLLDKMLSAIALDRKTNTFISNVNYWRPPGNRNPEADELAVCRPFVDRMIDLAQPRLIIATGGVAAKSLLNTRTGIMRLRGTEHIYETPHGTCAALIPMFHPAYLLRRAQDKSRTWRDLLLVEARLQAMGITL